MRAARGRAAADLVAARAGRDRLPARGRGAGAAARLRRARGARAGRRRRAWRSRASPIPTLEADGEVEDVANDDDPLLLVYTSGTTGKPKGALLTHANCFWTNLSFDRTAGLRDDDVVLQVLPQFHVGGWNVQPLLAWWRGATVVLEPPFDAARALRLIAEERVTTMMGVPATYLFLSQEPGFAEADLSSLRLAVVGGAPMPESLLETWIERGVEIVQGYGLTEAAPNVLCLPPEDARRKLGFAGKPYPHVDVALRDAETGTLVDGAGSRRARRPRPERLRGLLAQPGGDRGRVRGRLAAHRRRRRAGRGGVLPDRRKDQGHGHLGRRERLSGGDRGRPRTTMPRCSRPRSSACPTSAGARHVSRSSSSARAPRRRRRSSSSTARERLARFKVPEDASRSSTSLPRSSMGKVLKDELRAGAAGVTTMSETATSVGRAAALEARRAHAPPLLEAAESVFAELGYHDASIVKITEAAGVGQGTFYLYFASKKDVFDELVVDLNHRVRQAMTEARLAGDDPRRDGAARVRRRSSASSPSIRRSTGSSARPSSSRPRCSSSTTSG